MQLFREHLVTYKTNGPQSNIARRVFVCVVGMAARTTDKLRLTFSVGFIAMSTLRTSPRCIARVNQHEIDTGELQLVRDESAKLRERPAAHLGSLLFPEPCPLPNMRQILQRNSALRACSKFNELLTDNVVFMFAKVRLPRFSSPQGTANSLRALTLRLAPRRGVLQSLTALMVSLTHRLNRIAREVCAVARGRQANHAQVNADKVRHGSQGLIGQVNGHQQKPLAVFSENEIALTFGVGKPLTLIRAHDEWDDHAPLQSQKTHAVNALETHHSLIERHRSVLAELRQLLSASLVRLADLRDTAHRHLSGQAKLCSHVFVEQLLQLHLVGRPQVKRFYTQPVRCLIEASERFTQKDGLGGVWQQLDLKCQLHRRIVSLSEDWHKRTSAFLPSNELRGFQ